MSDRNQALYEQVRELYEKHGWGRKRIADHLGVGESSVRRHLLSIKGDSERAVSPEDTRTHVHADFDEVTGKGYIFARGLNIKTLDDAIKESGADMNLWRVVRWSPGSSEVSMKKREYDEEGRAIDVPITVTNFNIKVWLEPLPVEERNVLHRDEILDEAKRVSPKIPKIKRKKVTDPHMVELAVPDLHLGQLCWGEEVGHNYDIKIAREIFFSAIDNLSRYAEQFNVEKIVFPVGNDFYNVDNMAGTTTAGTPQHEDVRWQKSYRYGRRMLVDAIQGKLSQIAPVDVVIVPGNHDRERCFYLGDSLEGWMHNDQNVTVDNSPRTRKFYCYGNTLLGYTHGKEERLQDLPMIMANDCPDDFARTLYHIWHLGHLHHERQMLLPRAEMQKTEVRILPSLVPADSWHTDKGYHAVRKAKLLVYHPEQGPVAEFNWHPA